MTCMSTQRNLRQLSVMVHTYNHNTCHTEAGGSRVQDHSKTLQQNKNKNEEPKKKQIPCSIHNGQYQVACLLVNTCLYHLWVTRGRLEVCSLVLTWMRSVFQPHHLFIKPISFGFLPALQNELSHVPRTFSLSSLFPFPCTLWLPFRRQHSSLECSENSLAFSLLNQAE